MRYSMPNSPAILPSPRYRPAAAPDAPSRSNLSEEVSANIRRELALSRLRPQFFADVAGISIGRARHIYNGRRSPTISEVDALSHALGVPLTNLISEVTR